MCIKNVLEYSKIKNLKPEQGLITATKSKETRNNILTWDIFKSLIPTFGKHS